VKLSKDLKVMLSFCPSVHGKVVSQSLAKMTFFQGEVPQKGLEKTKPTCFGTVQWLSES
jgi:hypothetical protein